MSRIRFFAIAGLLLAVSASCLLATTGASARDNANASSNTAAFEKLKTLAGEWEAASEKGIVTSNFTVVSNGTALLERIHVPNEGEMVTVYYLDGNRLVLTHYCSAGNQPHMQAEAFDPASNQIRFDFASATNLADAGDGHMHAAVIKFLGTDAFRADWTFFKDGKAAFTEPIQFHRVR